MTVELEQIEQLLSQLDRAEKSRLLVWIASELSGEFTGIESDPQICGGEPCIVRTRIPVWLLEQSRRLGKSEAEIMAAFPLLRAEDLSNAWNFVRSHREEIERQIQENEAA